MRDAIALHGLQRIPCRARCTPTAAPCFCMARTIVRRRVEQHQQQAGQSAPRFLHTASYSPRLHGRLALGPKPPSWQPILFLLPPWLHSLSLLPTWPPLLFLLPTLAPLLCHRCQRHLCQRLWSRLSWSRFLQGACSGKPRTQRTRETLEIAVSLKRCGYAKHPEFET